MEKIRLQKFLSECGILSRRAAEAEISLGKVKVNGIAASIGDKVNPETDIVEYNGKPIKYSGSDKSHCTYIILNKPVGYVTTMSDEKGRLTVADIISAIEKRLYPVGRLDMFSDGLLICTDDGELTNKLTHPSHSVSKKYIAHITAHLTPESIEEMSVPFEVDSYMLRPYEVKHIGYERIGNTDGTVVEFTLHEGRNREIRRICEHYGYKLTRLTRVSIGEISLGELAIGKYRYLSDDEITYLKSI